MSCESSLLESIFQAASAQFKLSGSSETVLEVAWLLGATTSNVIRLLLALVCLSAEGAAYAHQQETQHTANSEII